MKNLRIFAIFAFCLFLVRAFSNGQNFVSDKVLPNYRAFALQVNAAAAKMVKTGDSVDILFSFETILKNKKTETMAGTLLQNIKVLDAAKVKGINYIVLQISHVEAEYLALVLENSSLNPVQIILRATGDNQIYPIELTGLSKLESGYIPKGGGNKKLYALPVACRAYDNFDKNTFVYIDTKMETGREVRLTSNSVSVQDKFKINEKNRYSGSTYEYCYLFVNVVPETAQSFLVVENSGGKFFLTPVKR
jgi:hypothetical protein